MQHYNIFILAILFFFTYISVVYFLTYFENLNQIKSKKPKRYPKISIIIPAYNEEKTIEKTIKSLLRQKYPKEKIEIIVVDNNSTDNTYRTAKKYEKFGVKVIKEKKPGKGAALNAGLKICTGDIVGALDSDSFVLPDALEKMAYHFEDKKVISVTPSIKVWKAKNWLEKIQQLEYLSGAYFRKMFSFLGGIPITAGPLTLYRRDFLIKTKGWDENNICEDVELSLRAEKLFGKTENAIDVSVYTSGAGTFKKLISQRLRWYRGFIDNLWKYKELFSKKYGNLGVFILPVSVITILFGILITYYGIYHIIKNFINFIKNLILYDFSFKDLFDFSFDPYYFNFDLITLTTIILTSLGIFFLIKSLKHSEEKQPWLLAFIYFSLFYSFIFTFLWTLSIYYKITGKKIQWGKRSL